MIYINTVKPLRSHTINHTCVCEHERQGARAFTKPGHELNVLSRGIHERYNRIIPI